MTVAESGALLNTVSFHERGAPQLFGPFAVRSNLTITSYLWAWKVLAGTRVMSMDFVIPAEHVNPDWKSDPEFREASDKAWRYLMEAIK